MSLRPCGLEALLYYPRGEAEPRTPSLEPGRNIYTALNEPIHGPRAQLSGLYLLGRGEI